MNDISQEHHKVSTASKTKLRLSELRNVRGDLRYVNKNTLRVDHSYQRNLKREKSNSIAKDFSWPPFGVLSVAKRADGSLWVVDGQHRLEAAMRRQDVHDVPCIIYEVDGLTEEASDFRKMNKDRAPLKAIEVFRADLMAGDKAAILLDALARDNGVTITNAPTPLSLRCVGACLMCIKSNESAFVQSFPIAVSMHKGVPIKSEIVQGLWYLWDATNGEIGANVYRKRLLAAGVEALVQPMAAAKSFYQVGGPKVFARGIVNFLNKGMKVNKITIFEETA